MKSEKIVDTLKIVFPPASWAELVIKWKERVNKWFEENKNEIEKHYKWQDKIRKGKFIVVSYGKRGYEEYPCHIFSKAKIRYEENCKKEKYDMVFIQYINSRNEPVIMEFFSK
jgi:hypothetical protein